MSLYVGIEDSVGVRKNLLLSSKELIGVLKVYEEVKELREEKLALAYAYQKELKDILTLQKRIKKLLPKAPKQKKAKKVVPRKVVQKTKKVAKDTSGLRHLENELDAIEAKLNRLGKL